MRPTKRPSKVYIRAAVAPFAYVLCTFLYEGGFMVLLINFPAYGGTSDTAPIARTRQTKPLEQ